MTIIVKLNINEAELEKLNRKAARAGRAARTGQEIAESIIGDALKHNWVTADHEFVDSLTVMVDTGQLKDSIMVLKEEWENGKLVRHSAKFPGGDGDY